MTDADDERAAIRAAMQRLLDGTPQKSTGALSVLQLATEAGVKRWVLTHKHTDLADEFRSTSTSCRPIPPAYTKFEQQARDAQEANQDLRAQNRQLRAQVTAYARIPMSCTPLYRTGPGRHACRSLNNETTAADHGGQQRSVTN